MTDRSARFERMSVDAKDPAVYVGVQAGGGAAAQNERPAGPAAGQGVGRFAAVAEELAVQHDVEDGKSEGLSSVEREELRRLRGENKILAEEREILEKAVAFFASESKPR